METDKEPKELGDKKSYAGIPESEFVVSHVEILKIILLNLKSQTPTHHMRIIILGRC